MRQGTSWAGSAGPRFPGRTLAVETLVDAFEMGGSFPVTRAYASPDEAVESFVSPAVVVGS